jgi:hypothetical protein
MKLLVDIVSYLIMGAKTKGKGNKPKGKGNKRKRERKPEVFDLCGSDDEPAPKRKPAVIDLSSDDEEPEPKGNKRKREPDSSVEIPPLFTVTPEFLGDDSPESLLERVLKGRTTQLVEPVTESSKKQKFKDKKDNTLDLDSWKPKRMVDGATIAYLLISMGHMFYRTKAMFVQPLVVESILIGRECTHTCEQLEAAFQDSCQYLFVPLNVGLHWIMLLIRRIANNAYSVHVVDSVGGCGMQEAVKQVAMVMRFVRSAAKKCIFSDPVVFYDMPPKNQQLDNDCGFYAVAVVAATYLGLDYKSLDGDKVNLFRKMCRIFAWSYVDQLQSSGVIELN